MLKKTFVRASTIAFIALAICSHEVRAEDGPDTNRPNVLFIAVDDLNHWVGYMGRNSQAKTPNLDRLAARGVAFHQAHCAVPACNPARAALMSGLRPWNTACYLNANPWKQHIDEGLGLSKQFMNAGYHVAGSGKIYHSDSYYESEWSEYMPRGGVSATGKGVGKDEGFHEPLVHDLVDEDISDYHIVDWCVEQMNQPHDKPLFLACGLHKPHLPFAVPRKYYDMFPIDEIELPPHREDDLDDLSPAGIKMAGANGDHARFLKSGRWKDAIQSYLATVAYLDMNIGRLIDGLDKSPIAENTIIVLWGDHGWSFGEKQHWRKFALWEEETRAPLIWIAPGVTQPATRCDETVDFMTIYPTLCELTGIPIPDHVEGKSIAMMLRDPQVARPSVAITTHGYKNHAVRSKDWRYIRYADGSEELYDHRIDPYEWTNVVDSPDHLQILKLHRDQLPQKDRQPTKPAKSTLSGGKKKKK
ncbi:sulfatase [Rubripirellula reticaptiva]|uniref:Choline-sulfatase n=1 Tax=Rubripirellula reticaptiva TaxID=2528013 RepID=A0A5C6EG73_9BACT|nr:sulfatase [Rubripirellula reticaptiva]TWU47027.1 Choline-sulfatase [Rubripirellula reticaptiva]